MEKILYILGLIVGVSYLAGGMLGGAELSAEQQVMVGTIIIWVLITKI